MLVGRLVRASLSCLNNRHIISRMTGKAILLADGEMKH